MILFIINTIYKCLMKVKVDIVTSDDIKIYYTGKFQDFTHRYIIKAIYLFTRPGCNDICKYLFLNITWSKDQVNEG